MGFGKKMLIVYSLIVALAIGLLSGAFYYYSSKTFENNSRESMKSMVEKMSQQLEQLESPMEFISLYFIGNNEFRRSVATLSYMNRQDLSNGIYIHEANHIIKSMLYQDSIARNFHSVNIFNEKGDFFTSDYGKEVLPENILNKISRLPWLEQVKALNGKKLLLTPYYDPWWEKDEKVFGLVRTIEGEKGETGYIEVQMSYKQIEKIFNLPNDKNTRMLVITKDNKILYSNNITTARLIKHYMETAVKQRKNVESSKNPIIGVEEIIAKQVSEKLGVTIVMIQDKADLLKPFEVAGQLVFGIGLSIMAISLAGVYIFSRYLTKPIRTLKETMEKIEINNLPDYVPLESKNNEIDALNESFQNLKRRLKDSIDRELKSQSLKMQANFDSLQAQINPHFLYNILNVISGKGMEIGNEEIGEMCDSIASMLRYSTATTKREATIKEEIDHVENYLVLMKKRFEDGLEFDIQIDKELLELQIPKIVLEPLVENAIHHGFHNISRVMRISIAGVVEKDYWSICIRDNGQGFDKKVLKDLYKKLDETKKKLAHDNECVQLEMGGMGIVSTYARLLLFYKDGIDFQIENIPSGGAMIKLSGGLNNV
ncbi:MAG: integral rane sensor signal transduction histidine kinase [Clostridia bacterium]|jgi:two-component system sensor histidine kinase YesM|nr:integral rane sensor signal transduction histidine kinase [Clostridia bacterium]